MHTSDIAKASDLLRLHFRLELPVNLKELKSSFRAESLKLHPDRAEDKEAAGKAFVAMKSAYDTILSALERNPALVTSQGGAVGNGSSIVTRTVDGTPLYELGLGLGPTKNGRDCPRCNHDGYTKEFGRTYSVCSRCDDMGRVPLHDKCRRCNGSGEYRREAGYKSYACRACTGTGRFTQKHGREVTCRVCEGSGRVEKYRSEFVGVCNNCAGSGLWEHPHRRVRCPSCHGTKTIWGNNENSVMYHKCVECHGTGEKEIMNPVIPKGALYAFGQNR